MDLPAWIADIRDRLVRAEHHLEVMIGIRHDEDTVDATDGRGGAPLTPPGPALAPKPGNPQAAERIRELGGNLAKFWTEVTGRSDAMPPQALELAVAQAGLESSYGAGWKDKTAEGKGDMRGSHNYGARQCGGSDSGGAAWDCREYGDTTPNADGTSTPVPAKFRFYRDAEGRTAAENGAYYFLRDLTKTWPVLNELISGDVAAYAHRLGPDKANGGLYYYAGFGKTFAERERNYAKAIAARLPEVAAALGHDRVYATPPGTDPAIAGIGSATPTPALDPVTWVQIDAPGGYRIWTSAEPLSSGGVRVPLSFAQAIAAARDMNSVLTTRPLSDARWAQASDKRVTNPVPSKDGAHFNDPSQNAAFAATLGPVGTVLRHGGWKDTILDPLKPLVPSGPNSMAFYGWRKADGSTWQRGVSSDHNRDWIEYDSLHPVFRRDATLNGLPVDLLDEIARPGSPLVQAPVAPFLIEELRGSGSGTPVASADAVASANVDRHPGLADDLAALVDRIRTKLEDLA